MSVALTKKQRATQAGMDLIALCQTLTEDGSLDEQEVHRLMGWLADSEDCGLPSHAFLCQTVREIIADGRVTPDERKTLYKAVETVLPPDLRGVAKGKRAARELVERENTRRERREQAERNQPVADFDFFVAGVRYEGRAAIVAEHARAGDSETLVRDASNRHSNNAVQVRLANGQPVGFVPEEHALDLAPLLDGGHPYRARIKTVWRSSDGALVPIIMADIYRTDWKPAGT